MMVAKHWQGTNKRGRGDLVWSIDLSMKEMLIKVQFFD